MVEAILLDQKKIVPVCAWLTGEYGLKDLYLGVPVVLGRNGIVKVVELNLAEKAKADLYTSAEAVRKVLKALDDMKLF